MTVVPVPVTPPEPAPSEPAPNTPAPGFADALHSAQHNNAPTPQRDNDSNKSKDSNASNDSNGSAKPNASSANNSATTAVQKTATITDATVLALLAALTGVATTNAETNTDVTTPSAQPTTVTTKTGDANTKQAPVVFPLPVAATTTEAKSATPATPAQPAEPTVAAATPAAPATPALPATPASPQPQHGQTLPTAPVQTANTQTGNPAPAVTRDAPAPPPSFVPPLARQPEAAPTAVNNALAVTPVVPHAEQTVTSTAAVSPPATAAAPAAPPPPAEQLFTVLRPLQRTPDGAYQLRLELRPPELGRVDLRVEFRDGVMHATIHAEHAQTAELVRNSLDDLRSRLNADGMRAGELTVNDGGNGAREQGQQAATPNPEGADTNEAQTSTNTVTVDVTNDASSDNVLDVRI